jgi:Bacteriophage Sf6, terminase small subunit-like
MSNLNCAYDVDEALARWDSIKIEEAEDNRRKAIEIRKNALAYSEPLAIEICERISSGELLIVICNDEHMPTVRRVTQWLKENGDFDALYKESINDRLAIFEEQIIQIADDASRDFKEVTRNGRPQRVPDGEAIARAKLRVEVRFRHLKAGRPAKWGDSTTIVTKSEGEDYESMSTEELEKRIAAFEHKNRVVRAA